MMKPIKMLPVSPFPTWKEYERYRENPEALKPQPLLKFPKDWRIGLNVTPLHKDHKRYRQRGVVMAAHPSNINNTKPTVEDVLTIRMETGEFVQERALYWRPLS